MTESLSCIFFVIYILNVTTGMKMCRACSEPSSSLPFSGQMHMETGWNIPYPLAQMTLLSHLTSCTHHGKFLSAERKRKQKTETKQNRKQSK